MRSDLVIAYLAGFATAAVIGLILYRFRRQVAAVRQTADTQAGTTRQFITSSSENRYYNDFTRLWNTQHIAGDIVNLTEIFVEPHFLRAPRPADPSAEKLADVFHVVPQLHDLPASYAPYNLETLSVNELRGGERHLALLGLPGSGKSTALAIIALVASGEIELEALDTESDEIFQQETEGMTPDEKQKHLQRRMDTQERALEYLKQAQKKSTEEGKAHPVIEFKGSLPIFVHLRDIDLRPEAFGLQAASAGKGGKDKPGPTRALDPAEPLVKAMQAHVSVVTASTLPRMVYNRLNAGTCLVLIDGFEDLSADERAEKLTWLRQFIDIYGANFMIITGPAIGFDALLNLGLTPIFLRAWSDADFDKLIQKWTFGWPSIAGTPRKPAPLPDEKVVRRAQTNNRGRLPLDVTLKTWSAFRGDEQETGRRGWYDSYVRYRFSNAKDVRPALERIAAGIIDQGSAPLTKDKMKELATAALSAPGGRPSANVDDLLNKLTAHGSLLMVEAPSGLFSYSHPLVTDYLAGETLVKSDAATIARTADKPLWNNAMAFAAAAAPLDVAVTQRLASAPDLMFTALFSVVPWLIDSPSNATWRAEVFKRLTAALLAPSQYPTIRERAMAALVASRDKAVLFIFRQAVRSTDPNVRRLACVGMGALGDSEAVKDLQSMLTDPDQDVQLAAGLALGAIGTDAALETMATGLLEGEPNLQQAVAEALAAIPEIGHHTLRDAVQARDMQVRRAAVFGLARIKKAWALSLLYRTLLEDEQWYVKNAAEQVMKQMEQPERHGPMRHPEADSLEWLIAWAAKQGEGVPAGQNARQVLIRVLQEGDPATRAAAARTLANLGHIPALKPLYNALRDKDESVRSAVYESLNTFQTRLGENLPSVL